MIFIYFLDQGLDRHLYYSGSIIVYMGTDYWLIVIVSLKMGCGLRLVNLVGLFANSVMEIGEAG